MPLLDTYYWRSAHKLRSNCSAVELGGAEKRRTPFLWNYFGACLVLVIELNLFTVLIKLPDSDEFSEQNNAIYLNLSWVKQNFK